MSSSSPYAVICLPVNYDPSTFVKAYFPIEVVEYFKNDKMKWYYWPSEQDIYPEGFSPLHHHPYHYSLRVRARLFGDIVQKGNLIDFRQCSREANPAFIQPTNSYVMV